MRIIYEYRSVVNVKTVGTYSTTDISKVNKFREFVLGSCARFKYRDINVLALELFVSLHIKCPTHLSLFNLCNYVHALFAQKKLYEKFFL